MKLHKFGDPMRFEVAMEWLDDREERSRLPADGGWSSGKLKLTVGGHVLTHHSRDGRNIDSIEWYLFPIFEWLVGNWDHIFHEEKFAWKTNGSAAAATATYWAMREHIASDDAVVSENFTEIQAWWHRHALRAADSSALFPDIYFRRLSDDIEISWTARQPIHAPDGFRLSLSPGVAVLSVSEVAEPLWNALNWVLQRQDLATATDRQALCELSDQVQILGAISNSEFEKIFLPRRTWEHLQVFSAETRDLGGSTRLTSAPAISIFSDPVLMFGGVSPEIGVGDIKSLLAHLSVQKNGADSERLKIIVDTTIGSPIDQPYAEGYELAEDLLDHLNLPTPGTSYIDIHKILTDLNIQIKEVALETPSIRGIAIAGEGYSPCIIINTTSHFNTNPPGKRFTLAHELFHILYDRSRAKRITHASGRWAPPGVEKRANAFSAMLLMPRELIRKILNSNDLEAIRSAADALMVGKIAFVDHIFNLCLIDEVERDHFRQEFGY